MDKVEITREVQSALIKRGMAFLDDKDQFRLNRKGRRWLQKQVGRQEMRILNTEALRRSEKTPPGDRKQAWNDEKKLDS